MLQQRTTYDSPESARNAFLSANAKNAAKQRQSHVSQEAFRSRVEGTLGWKSPEYTTEGVSKFARFFGSLADRVRSTDCPEIREYLRLLKKEPSITPSFLNSFRDAEGYTLHSHLLVLGWTDLVGEFESLKGVKPHPIDVWTAKIVQYYGQEDPILKSMAERIQKTRDVNARFSWDHGYDTVLTYLCKRYAQGKNGTSYYYSLDLLERLMMLPETDLMLPDSQGKRPMDYAHDEGGVRADLRDLFRAYLPENLHYLLPQGFAYESTEWAGLFGKTGEIDPDSEDKRIDAYRQEEARYLADGQGIKYPRINTRV